MRALSPYFQIMLHMQQERTVDLMTYVFMCTVMSDLLGVVTRVRKSFLTLANLIHPRTKQIQEPEKVHMCFNKEFHQIQSPKQIPKDAVVSEHHGSVTC